MRALKNLFRASACFALCLVATNTFAQRERFSAEKFVDKAGDTLRYNILGPDDDISRSTPLVIFLHGSGERGTDNQAQLKWGAMAFATDQMMSLHPAVVIVPQCPPGQQWGNFDRGNNGMIGNLRSTPTTPMQALRELIDQVVKNYHVDTKRIYITGLSMGGMGTFDAVERYPDLFAAALPVCGGGDVSKIGAAAKIPMWICAGRTMSMSGSAPASRSGRKARPASSTSSRSRRTATRSRSAGSMATASIGVATTRASPYS